MTISFEIPKGKRVVYIALEDIKNPAFNHCDLTIIKKFKVLSRRNDIIQGTQHK